MIRNSPAKNGCSSSSLAWDVLVGSAPGGYARYGYPNAAGRSTVQHNIHCQVNRSKIMLSSQGARSVPPDGLGDCLTMEEADGDHTAQLAIFGMSMETHSGEDIITRCKGPLAHLCAGTKDNTYVGVLIQYALGVNV